MLTIKISGDRLIADAVTRISGKIANARPALAKIGERVAAYSKDNMESEGTLLTKQRWQKLTPQTLAAKARMGYGGKKILERSGDLKNAFRTLELTNRRVVIGNSTKYYPYHQLGGNKIPKRQIMGVNSDIEKIVVDELKNHISF